MFFINLAFLACQSASAQGAVFQGAVGPHEVRVSLERVAARGRFQAWIQYQGRDRILELKQDEEGVKPRFLETPRGAEKAVASWEFSEVSPSEGIRGVWISFENGQEVAIHLKPLSDYRVEPISMKAQRKVLGRGQSCSIRTFSLDPGYLKKKPSALRMVLEAFEESILKDQASNQCSTLAEPNSSLRYEIECSAHALQVKDRFLSLLYTCSGIRTEDGIPGENPKSSRHALVFDLKERKVVPLTEWFDGPLELPDQATGKPSYYLSTLGLSIFYPTSSTFRGDTIPYWGFSKNLGRYGKPSVKATLLDF